MNTPELWYIVISLSASSIVLLIPFYMIWRTKTSVGVRWLLTGILLLGFGFCVPLLNGVSRGYRNVMYRSVIFRLSEVAGNSEISDAALSVVLRDDEINNGYELADALRWLVLLRPEEREDREDRGEYPPNETPVCPCPVDSPLPGRGAPVDYGAVPGCRERDDAEEIRKSALERTRRGKRNP